MAQALFITTKDIKQFTAIGGNVDVDKFIQWVKVAQDIDIQGYLGTELFNRINNDIVNDTLTGDYLTLVNKFIKPMVIWYGFYRYIPYADVSIQNKGAFKFTAENSVNLDYDEKTSIESRALIIAQNYADRFVKHMCFNSSTYPEYNSNSNDDISPNNDVNYTNWFL